MTKLARTAVSSPVALSRALALTSLMSLALLPVLAACEGSDGSDEPECGDDVVEGDELCDGTDLNDETCISLGYGDGELACQANCQGFNRSGCSGGTVIIGDGDGDGDGDPGDGDGDGDPGDGDGDGDGDPGDGDGDGDGDPPCVPEDGDLDCDTIPDGQDNCPEDPNLNQADLDSDGLGNPCDPDQDGDGYDNEDDCAPFEPQINPGAEEIPDNPIDENCDGETEGTVSSGPTCPEDCVGTSVEQMLCAMEICYEDLLTSAETIAPNGDDISGAIEAVAHYGDTTNGLVPEGPSYVVMASGLVDSASHQDSLPGSTTSEDPFSDDGYPVHDSVEFKVTLTAPSGAHGFSIDYIFMSQEYEEFVGSSFNDKFYMILNAPETTGGEDRIINFAACSDPTAHTDFFIPGEGPYCYIAINSAFSEPCSSQTTSLAGTGYEAMGSFTGGCGIGGGSSTGWLRTSWTINAGETFDLTFHIHDASDQAYDSAVVLDNFLWQGADVKPGTEN